MKIGRAAVATDTGKRRLENEDAYVFEPPLFVIADGMGGARAGEVAAGLAAEAFEEVGARSREDGFLEEIIADANRRIWERSRADPETAGMGTTITVAIVEASTGRVAFGHVGDSRAYRLRDGELEQVTTDHSLVAELVESGMLTPEEADRHPQRSAITRALGTEPDVEPDIFTIQAEPGDLFLLCSDGLSDMLTEDDIAEVIEAAERDPTAAGEALVVAANAEGGEDNITVVIFEMIEGEDDADEPAAVTQASVSVVDRSESAGTGGDTDTAVARSDEPRRHGAGPGGRIAALALIVALLVVCLVVLYLAVR